MKKSPYSFKYRIRNWSDYNQALIARGHITFWFDEEAVSAWRNTDPNTHPGKPEIYSDTAIHCSLTLKEVFHLSLRAAQGFLASLMNLVELDLPVPNYSPLSRRQRHLAVPLPLSSKGVPRHIVIDSTGLKVFGEEEWHRRKHGAGRRRRWRKLHLGVDERTKEIVAVKLTQSSVHDSRRLPALLNQIPGEVSQVSGDGAYDTKACYESMGKRGAVATIPPRRSARCWKRIGRWFALRNANLRQIKEKGRYEWRVSSGCTRQSLVENAMSRLKGLLSSRLSAWHVDNQRAEAIIKCAILNRMTSLGMPESVRI